MALGAFRITLVGTAAGGKSAIANLIASRPVVPMGVQPTTLIETLITYHEVAADVVVVNGHRNIIPTGEETAAHVRAAFPVARSWIRVEAAGRSSLSHIAVETSLLDTPGIRGVSDEARLLRAQAACASADILVCVFNAEETDDRKERVMLRRVLRSIGHVPVIFVLNRADSFQRERDPAGALSRAIESRRAMVADALETSALPEVVPLAATAGLSACAIFVDGEIRTRSVRADLARHAWQLSPCLIENLPRRVEQWQDDDVLRLSQLVRLESGAGALLERLESAARRVLGPSRSSAIVDARDTAASEPPYAQTS
jgi:hypothetical protein